MDSNISVYHETETRTMAFRGSIKPERWSRILNLVDNMTRVVVSRAIGEGIFNYDFTWRTNSSIIGAFIGCLAKAELDKWEMSRLYSNLFNSVWTHGMEEAIRSLDDRGRVPAPEIYMSHPPVSLAMAFAPRRSAIVIRNSQDFFEAWPNMKVSINFLLRWRGIKDDFGNEWLLKYLNTFNAYIEPGIDMTNWTNLEYSLPNFDKSSKERTTLVFHLDFASEDFTEISEIIMVYDKHNSSDE
jgi:hypothetical protein